MNDLNGIFGFLGVVCGVYCLYAYFMMRFKGKIIGFILLPKGVDVKKCKDHEGYCKEAQFPVLIMGIVAVVYGCADLYTTYAGGSKLLTGIMIVVLLVVTVIYAAWTQKINKKYFDL